MWNVSFIAQWAKIKPNYVGSDRISLKTAQNRRKPPTARIKIQKIDGGQKTARKTAHRQFSNLQPPPWLWFRSIRKWSFTFGTFCSTFPKKPQKQKIHLKTPAIATNSDASQHTLISSVRCLIFADGIAQLRDLKILSSDVNSVRCLLPWNFQTV